MPAKLMLNEQITGAAAAWGAGRHLARSADGTCFLAVQDGINGKLLRRLADGTWTPIPLAPQPTMRPTLHAGPWGLIVCAGYDHDAQTILAWLIDDYQWPADAALSKRVDALQAANNQQEIKIAQLQQQVGTIQQRLNELETALGNVASGGAALTAEQQAALDWVIQLRALLRGAG